VQLGFVSAILPDLSLEEVARFAAAEGFECVELMCWPAGKAERRYAGVTHVDVARLDAGEAQRVKEIMAAAGVGISGLGYYPNPLSPDAGEAAVAREHLEKVIRAAPLLGLSQVNTFVGRDPAKSVDENWPRFLDTWRPLIRLAEDSGVRIGIENCPCSSPATNGPAARIWRPRPPFGAGCLATFPAGASASTTTPRTLSGSRSTAWSRCSNSPTGCSMYMPKTPASTAGRSTKWASWPIRSSSTAPSSPAWATWIGGRFISVLGDVGYDGPVCIEVEDRAYEGSLAARQQALRQSGGYLRQFMGKRAS